MFNSSPTNRWEKNDINISNNFPEKQKTVWKLTRMHVRQINDNRRLIDERNGQIAVQTKRSRAFQADGLNPVSRLRVEDVQVRFGEDQQVAITVG